MRGGTRRGFTLIELLVTISIIAMLATLLMPTLGKAMAKARTTACVGNLRSLGVAVQSYANDHDGRYPTIESRPNSGPIYPDDPTVKPLLETLEPYGLTAAMLRCPSDVAYHDWLAKEGSSYDWKPIVDDELTGAAKIYTPHGQFVPPPSRLALALDFERAPGEHMNRLYADGRVKTR
jgi:prepilin-type N-terminal cleavage/methylation domain-containing protein